MKYATPGVLLVIGAGASGSLDLAGLPAPGSGGGGSAVTSSPSTSSGTDPKTSGAGGAFDPASSSAASSSSSNPSSASTASSSSNAASSAAASTSAASTGAASSSSTGGGVVVWTKRRLLTLTCGPNVNLVDFPVLVKLNGGRINYAAMQKYGEDLRFTDAQGTVLDHEIEHWDSSGDSFVWLRVPNLEQRQQSCAQIWMYYGNPSAPDAQNAHGIWSSGYQGVWHLDDQGNTLPDSAGKNADAVNHGANVSDGSIGKGRSFDAGASQYIDTLNHDDLQTFTVEVWARGKNDAVMGGGPNGPLAREKNYSLVWDQAPPAGASATYFSQSGLWISASFKGLSGNAWHYLVAVHDGLRIRSYKDGALQNETLGGPPQSEGATAKLGRHATNAAPENFFDGAVDEVRISAIPHTDRWITLQYRSMTDNGLVNFGAEATGNYALP